MSYSLIENVQNRTLFINSNLKAREEWYVTYYYSKSNRYKQHWLPILFYCQGNEYQANKDHNNMTKGDIGKASELEELGKILT